MASQQEAIKFIKSNYNTEELGEGTLKLVFDLGDGRSQLVIATVNESNVQFSSPFAKVDDVTAKIALEANSEFSLGMQIIGDFYMVKHVAPLADLDASEINDAFEMIANIADELEKKLLGGDAY